MKLGDGRMVFMFYPVHLLRLTQSFEEMNSE